MFGFLAMEMLADEQKLLDNTRVYFWKTAAFYSHDGRQSTPNDFFQVSCGPICL